MEVFSELVKISINDVPEGSVFEYEGEMYLKVPIISVCDSLGCGFPSNAINLTTGKPELILNASEVVWHPKATIN